MTSASIGGSKATPELTRRRKPGAVYRSAAWRQRVSEGVKRSRELRRKLLDGTSPDLARDAVEIINELGGVAHVTAQRRKLGSALSLLVRESHTANRETATAWHGC
jgi:hypothetical protein